LPRHERPVTTVLAALTPAQLSMLLEGIDRRISSRTWHPQSAA
jgi:hypothetical protein